MASSVVLIYFLTDSINPISIAAKDSFRNVFSNTNIQITDRQVFGKYILDLSWTTYKNVKSDRNEAKFVNTTADRCSRKKINFLRMTCHWIDKESLKRKAVVSFVGNKLKTMWKGVLGSWKMKTTKNVIWFITVFTISQLGLHCDLSVYSVLYAKFIVFVFLRYANFYRTRLDAVRSGSLIYRHLIILFK